MRFVRAPEPLSSMWAQQRWPGMAAEKLSRSIWQGKQTEGRRSVMTCRVWKRPTPPARSKSSVNATARAAAARAGLLGDVTSW